MTIKGGKKIQFVLANRYLSIFQGDMGSINHQENVGNKMLRSCELLVAHKEKYLSLE